jgi:hypothetical protein
MLVLVDHINFILHPLFEFAFGLSYTTFSYTWYNDSHPGQYHILIDNQRMLTMKLHGNSTLWQRFK